MPLKEGELFCIANISEGFGYKNNAVSPVYNEAKAEDGEYDLKWYHIVDANYAQALKFTPVEGKRTNTRSASSTKRATPATLAHKP